MLSATAIFSCNIQDSEWLYWKWNIKADLKRPFAMRWVETNKRWPCMMKKLNKLKRVFYSDMPNPLKVNMYVLLMHTLGTETWALKSSTQTTQEGNGTMNNRCHIKTICRICRIQVQVPSLNQKNWSSAGPNAQSKDRKLDGQMA